MVSETQRIPWMKGRRHTEESRRKMSKAHRGKKFSKQHRRKMSENHARYWKGKPRSEKTRNKISKAHKGRTLSEKTKRKISMAKLGCKMSEEARRKLSESIRGEKHWNWKGGHERYYGPNWNRQKRLVRERDRGICWNCHITEDGREHAIHHIIPFRVFGLERYKEANRLDNLMTLCGRCHTRIEMITVEENISCLSH